MEITVNERLVDVAAGESLFQMAARIKPDADLLIWNGYPVENDRPLSEGDQVALIRRGERPSLGELEALMRARHTPGAPPRGRGPG